MNALGLVAFGWLVPGGAYLLMRRYLQFAVFAFVVTAAFVAGFALQGGYGWPQPAALAGAPYLATWLLGGSGSFLGGRLHEYGTTLLTMAGLFNVLAVSSALDLRMGSAQ